MHNTFGQHLEAPMRESIKSLKLSPEVEKGFLRLYDKFRTGRSKISDWESICSPDDQVLVNYGSLGKPDSAHVKSQLQRLAICKLNGGLGTSMGCDGPKSAITVRENSSFLDLIVEQLSALQRRYEISVPLVLMNSFYTHEATAGIVAGYRDRCDIQAFQQNKYPRIMESTHIPLALKDPGLNAWYPPGHGDFYNCILENHILDGLLERGREVLFVANADNLGAVPDPCILNFMLEREIPFLIEMTPKTLADVKGGTLYQEKGQLKLLEVSSVPEQHVDEFCGQEKFRVFNTNNIWINLTHLRKTCAQSPLDLDVIVNRKMVDGEKIIQLETAIGSALECFPGAIGLNVSRDRFLPVKTTDDLLLVQSDLFILEEGRLFRNPKRKLPGLPRICFGKTLETLEEYQNRFPFTPKLIDLASLEVEGDVRFEGKAELIGDVRLISRKKPILIPDGMTLENTTIES